MRVSIKRWCGASLAGVLSVAMGASLAIAHPGHGDETGMQEPSPLDVFVRGGGGAEAESQVEIVERDGFRAITANGIPNHPTGEFPNRGNPNAIRPQRYSFRVTLKPVASEKPTSIRHNLFGVALNGVPFDPGTAEFWNNDRQAGWNYEALTGALDLGIDRSKAHVQPTGAYHYHGVPVGLVYNLSPAVRTDDLADRGGPPMKRPMLLLGYAADGFPIYWTWAHADANDAKSDTREMKSSYRLKKGTRPGGDDGPGGKHDGTFTSDFEYAKGSGDLDECNGREGVTPEYPKGTYYYVLTDDFPFIPRFWRGTPDESFQKRGPGPGGPGGGGPGAGPRGRGPGGPGGGPPGRGERRGPPPPPLE